MKFNQGDSIKECTHFSCLKQMPFSKYTAHREDNYRTAEAFVSPHPAFDGWWRRNDKDSYENSYKDPWGRGDPVNGHSRHGKSH